MNPNDRNNKNRFESEGDKLVYDCATFADLCEHLIEEEGHNYLYPRIYRTRPTD